jgi:Protein of unknown function (DUF2459)
VLPNKSVLHVVGWDDPPEEYFPGDIVRLQLTPSQVQAICRHIHDTYDRDQNGHVKSLGPGIYGDSNFYRARGKYYAPKTCNVWTARALQSAGLSIRAETCSLAGAVIRAARREGTVIRSQHGVSSR